MSEDHPTRRGIETVAHLAQHVAEVLTDDSIILCVGNDICGDDGAGPAVARRIAGKVRWRVLDVQTVPESFLMKVVAAKPDVVMIVDALDFDAEPGAVELLASDAVTGQGPSTHGPAPIAFLDLLNMMHPCRRVILGIQPVTGDFGEAMTPAVAKAIDFVAEALALASEQGHQAHAHDHGDDGHSHHGRHAHGHEDHTR